MSRIKSEPKVELVYEIISHAPNRHGNAFGVTTIWIGHALRFSLAEQIANCIRDEDYHGTPDPWIHLLKADHRSYYRWVDSDAIAKIGYQWYTCDQTSEESYCAHNIDLHAGLRGLTKVTKLLTRIMRKIAKAEDGEWYDPKGYYYNNLNDLPGLVRTLDQMKAVRITRSDTYQTPYASTLVPAGNEELTFRTSGVKDPQAAALTVVAEGGA